MAGGDAARRGAAPSTPPYSVYGTRTAWAGANPHWRRPHRPISFPPPAAAAAATATTALAVPSPQPQRPCLRGTDAPDSSAVDTYKVFSGRPCLPEANDKTAAGSNATAASTDGAPGAAGAGRASALPDAAEPEPLPDGEEYGDPPVAGDMDDPEGSAGEGAAQDPDPGLVKAIDAYRRLFKTDEMTDKDLADLDERVRAIIERPVVELDVPHDPVEIAPGDDNAVMVGPPVLTRFEKARIMGARALQLSEGAPAFVEIPESAMTSLDIAMAELGDRVIPITIRRALPNGDYQNIPIDYFKP